MVTMGVSKLGQMVLIFIDAKVKIRGAYYCEVLLTQKLLPVMFEICGEFFYPAARQCCCSLSAQDNQPSGMRHLHSPHQTFHHPTSQI